MKKNRSSRDIQKNASKLHKHVLSLLVELFPTFTIQQEIRVSEINPSFKSNRERFDLCVVELNMCIELHGIQHFKETCFGGITIDEARKNLIKRQEVDYLKEKAARDNGWGYVVISYKEKNITKEDLLKKINLAIEEIVTPEEVVKKDKVKLNSNNKFSSAVKNKIKNNNKLQSKPFPKQEKKEWPKRKIWNN